MTGVGVTQPGEGEGGWKRRGRAGEGPELDPSLPAKVGLVF